MTADPISTVYAVTSAVIGLMAGLFAAKGWFKDIKTVLLAGLIIGVVAATVSTPLNILFLGGQTGNVWGDALYVFADFEWATAMAGFFLGQHRCGCAG